MLYNISRSKKHPKMADNRESQSDSCQDLPQVLVLEPPPILQHYPNYFSNKFQLLKAWDYSLPLNQFLATQAQSVRALLSPGRYPLNQDILRLIPSLQLIVTTSAGLNHIDLPECRRRGISIANAGNVFTEDSADLGVALLIDVLRKITAADGYVRQGLWAKKGDFPLGSKLGGKRVGIVGLGNIGMEVAKRLRAFGSKILYTSRKEKPHVSYAYYSNVYDLATESDALIICCGLTDETRNIINKPVMEALGKDGVIVNIGRGGIVNEKELIECLVEGKIGGAGLDVFEKEPNVPEELLTMENVVLSPHRAVHTPESLISMCEHVARNLEAFFSNKPLISLVLDL
ncbi:glyoxylate/hydroxypyruvate reductase HPR3-like [Ziziphus jujuba]|uniref:glyoxylate reductase (NADP(+)) n=1 Tax=Ziziphus jujuba TaxID=326968 RepID=A0A6P4AUI1_ZIZJJ|nr:glyoxylate/hydroxypyruvate reductase HPR3-like [Ziziphus jujuba]